MESVESLPDPFDPFVKLKEQRIQEELAAAGFSEEFLRRLEESGTPPSTALVRAMAASLLRVYPDIPDPVRTQLSRVGTMEELEAVLDPLDRRGRRAHFRVLHAFRGVTTPEVDIWSDFSDCGLRFVAGETYLVYSNGTDRLQTNICSGTTSLDSAGEDLAYLFVQGQPASSRLYGLLTSDPADRAFDQPRGDRVDHPVPGVVLELSSEKGTRCTSVDRNGRFIFDGLAAGEYRLSIFNKEWPEERSLIDGPRGVGVTAGSCTRHVFVVPPQP